MGLIVAQPRRPFRAVLYVGVRDILVNAGTKLHLPNGFGLIRVLLARKVLDQELQRLPQPDPDELV